MERKLDELLKDVHALRLSVNTINRRHKRVMNDLNRLNAAVAANGSVIDSAIVLIKGLAEAIKNIGNDQAALDALASDLEAQAAALAASVAENTPAA